MFFWAAAPVATKNEVDWLWSLRTTWGKKCFLSEVVKMDERGFTCKVNLAWSLGHKTMELKQNDGRIPVYSLNGSAVSHSYPFDPSF